MLGSIIDAGSQGVGTYTVTDTRTGGWAVCPGGSAATLKFGTMPTAPTVTLPASSGWLEVNGDYQEIEVLTGTVAFVVYG